MNKEESKSHQNSKQHLSYGIYLISATVFLASFAATWLLQVPDIFKGIASLPGTGALVYILVQLYRDRRFYERSIELLQRQQDFALGTASHMANVAYDKHIFFCEAYINRTINILGELFQSGPAKNASNFASDLMSIRKKHATWLTTEIESKLISFESAIRKIGLGMQRLENLPVGKRRSQLVEQIFKSFGIVISEEKPSTEEEGEIAATRIIDHLRGLLGIKELTELRLNAVRLALRRMADAGDNISLNASSVLRN